MRAVRKQPIPGPSAFQAEGSGFDPRLPQIRNRYRPILKLSTASRDIPFEEPSKNRSNEEQLVDEPRDAGEQTKISAPSPLVLLTENPSFVVR